MYLKEYLKQYENKKIKIYVDMDGVIVDYQVGVPYDFHKKRPLKSSISKLEEISKMENIELYILSISRLDEGINQKEEWLDNNAPFFKKENRVIISRESNEYNLSSYLKAKYLKELNRDDGIIIIIDDDPLVLKEIKKTCEDIVLLKDTVLVD